MTAELLVFIARALLGKRTTGQTLPTKPIPVSRTPTYTDPSITGRKGIPPAPISPVAPIRTPYVPPSGPILRPKTPLKLKLN